MPRRTHLFIDKISFTLHIERNIRNIALALVRGMVDEGLVTAVHAHSTQLTKDYRYAYKVPLGTEFASLQLEPRAGNVVPTEGTEGQRRKRFLRVEWNPSKVAAQGEGCARHLWDIIYAISGMSPQQLLAEMNVTRIDLSFDVFDLNINRINVFTTLRKVNSVRHAYPDGSLNAIELGKRTSSQQMVIYDKLREREAVARNNTHPRLILTRNGTILRRSRQCTRFELRLTDSQSIFDLGARTNPFEKYTVREIRYSPQLSGRIIPAYFMDSCLLRGMQAALSQIKEQRLRTYLAESVRELPAPSWWNPASLWAELEPALSRLLV